MIKYSALMQAIELLKVEIDKIEKYGGHGMRYQIGFNTTIQYDEAMQLLELKENEDSYYIYRNELNYKKLSELPACLTKLEFYIN
ncbi:MAG: hypothetical protein ACRCX8_00575 [Sarcina sp.]